MSSIYDACFKVLKNVLKEKELFSVSLKRYANGIQKVDFQHVSSLSGLYLRNYYFISTLSEDIIGTVDLEPKIYLGLAFVNIGIKKIVDEEETIKYLRNKLSLYQIKFDEDKTAKFLNAIKDKRSYLKNYYANKSKKSGFKYLSSRNNLPEWVVTSLIKQYDKDISIKTINAMTKMPRQFALINTLLPNEINENFVSGFNHIEGDLYELNSTSSIRKHVNVRNGGILPVQLGEYDFLKSLPEIKNGNVTMYFEGRNGIYASFAKKYLAENKVSLISPFQKDNPELFSKVKGQRTPNLDIYMNNESGIVAHLSEKQDLMIFMPYSSDLELLRRIPEYGILFDTNTLDAIIENENKGLDDVTQYVKEGGYLVYAVPTFNIKETLIVSKTFLANHKEYSLEKEKLFFPYEKENSVFYFAIYKRK